MQSEYSIQITKTTSVYAKNVFFEFQLTLIFFKLLDASYPLFLVSLFNIVYCLLHRSVMKCFMALNFQFLIGLIITII